jgi:hypothetical protein
VCSNTGSAIAAIAAAIDQLAEDARQGATAPEMAARLAGIWSMVTALDPELARRQQGYTGPADDTTLG